MNKELTVDCYGLQCPMPIIKTAQAIKAMQVGQVLELIATDAGVGKDMPAWCKTTGQEFVALERDGDTYKVYIKKVK
jgi:tRNA 2-thiouridine synthesizing protein A